MWKEIGQVFSKLGRLGDGCRSILLIGSGKGFCGGIDISDPSFMIPDGDGDVARRGMGFLPQILEMQQALSSLEECPVPVVCAIHGSCIGAGIDLSCCADVRLCCNPSTFSVREVKLGLAADVGTLQRLPKIVGHGSRVRELCLTGSDFDAMEALRIGYVSRVLASPRELLQDALKLCCLMAQHSPVAVVSTKKSLNYSRDHTVAEGLEHIAMHNAMALMSEDMVNSFTAVASGAKPTFAELAPHARL